MRHPPSAYRYGNGVRAVLLRRFLNMPSDVRFWRISDRPRRGQSVGLRSLATNL